MSVFPMKEGKYQSFSIWADEGIMHRLEQTMDIYSEQIEKMTGIDYLNILNRDLDNEEMHMCVFACYILHHKYREEDKNLSYATPFNHSTDQNPFEDIEGVTR